MNEEINRNENVTAAENADHDTSTEKHFTQEELDQLISERLKRERKNNECLTQLRTALDKLRTDGVTKSSSYSDIVSELLARCPSENETQESETNPRPVTTALSSKNDLTPDGQVLTTGEKSPAENDPLNGEKPDNAVGKPIASMTLDELYALSARYPTEEVAADVLSEGFRAFTEGRSGTPEDIYGAYLRVKHALVPADEKRGCDETSDRVCAAPQISRGSSAFGTDAYGGNLPDLTKKQMELARENGMSLREYAALLCSIPTRSRT